MTLESRLRMGIPDPDTIALLLETLEKELFYLKDNPAAFPKLSLRKIATHLAYHAPETFLSVVEKVLDARDLKQGTNPYGSYINQIVKAVQLVESVGGYQQRINEVRNLFLKMGISIAP